MKKSALLAIVLALLAPAGVHAIQRQEAMNWCWAASIQDVLYQGGVVQRQVDIAAVLDGWPRDRPAYIPEVVAVLQYYHFRAWQAGGPGSPEELYSTLTSGWKLIAFVQPTNGPVGHYIVLEGVDPGSGAIAVADPATGYTNWISLNDLYYGWRWVDSVVVGR